MQGQILHALYIISCLEQHSVLPISPWNLINFDLFSQVTRIDTIHSLVKSGLKNSRYIHSQKLRKSRITGIYQQIVVIEQLQWNFCVNIPQIDKLKYSITFIMDIFCKNNATSQNQVRLISWTKLFKNGLGLHLATLSHQYTV